MAHITTACRGWWKEDGSNEPSELDQKTAFADRDARSWNGTPAEKGTGKIII